MESKNELNEEEEETLPSFLCPIDQIPMDDPVVLESGHSYNDKAIKRWFDQGNSTDPVTNLPVKRRRITNYALKNAIQEYNAQLVQMQVKKKLLEQYRLWYEMKEQQKRMQTTVMLTWFKDLLQSNMNLDNSQNLKMWYCMFTALNGDIELLTPIFQQHVEKVTNMDHKEMAKLKGILCKIDFPNHLTDLILSYCEIIVFKAVNSSEYVSHFLEKHEMFEKCNLLWFDSATWCKIAIHRAFEVVIDRDDAFSRHLANYTNDLLTKGLFSLTEAEVKQKMKRISLLYEMIMEKDTFELHHQLFLAYRLSNDLCRSFTMEQDVINFFRKKAGFQWLRKLQGMLNEVQNPMFHSPKIQQFDMNLIVCSSGYWPTLPDASFHSPEDLVESMNRMTQSFMWHFPDKKLNWRMDMGRAEVKVSFDEKVSKILVCTTWQMLILLAFNKGSRLTFRNILDITGATKNAIAHHLLSLAHPKVSILLKRPNTKALEYDHQFMINPKYTHLSKKIVVPLMRPICYDDDDETSDEKLIELQRKAQIDFCICCVMMGRKRLSEALLISEVYDRLRVKFIPKFKKIKKRIKAMIEQEYLERDKNDHSLLIYRS